MAVEAYSSQTNGAAMPSIGNRFFTHKINTHLLNAQDLGDTTRAILFGAYKTTVLNRDPSLENNQLLDGLIQFLVNNDLGHPNTDLVNDLSNDNKFERKMLKMAGILSGDEEVETKAEGITGIEGEKLTPEETYLKNYSKQEIEKLNQALILRNMQKQAEQTAFFDDFNNANSTEAVKALITPTTIAFAQENGIKIRPLLPIENPQIIEHVKAVTEQLKQLQNNPEAARKLMQQTDSHLS
jgi:hypothetical protein